MPPLSPKAVTLLRYLVSLLPDIIPGHPETFIGYSYVHKALRWELIGTHWANSLKYQGLLELAKWLRAQNLPAITGLVVDQRSMKPGGGYFTIHEVSEQEMYIWWEQEIARAKSMDWGPVLAHL